MSFSNFLEGELLDHVFSRDAGYAQPTLYIALSTADPLDAGTGLAEPVGNGYARIAHAAWNRTAGQISNNGAVTFPAATGAWGTITHFAIMDALSAGNLLMSGTVTPSQAVVNGNTPNFPNAQLTVDLD